MRNKAIITILFLVLTTIAFSQTQASDTTRILFIGNSYTYYNSSPELLKGLLREKFPNKVVETQLISQGGMTLELHWKVDRAREAIQSKDWDYVVLQEQSKLGMRLIIDDVTHFGQTDLFFEYARKFDAEIKKAGAKTVFFMTWSMEDAPKQQDILTHAYTGIAKELNAIVVPVGLVWDQVRKSDQMDLYIYDGSHPTQHGSYLVATTMFATLFGENPVGLSGDISGKRLSSTGEAAWESTPLTRITVSDAKVIQAASWSTVKKMNRRGYPVVKQPKPTYNIPSLAAGDNITTNDIIGKWYGTSSYSNDYDGLILNVTAIDDELKASLTFYTPDRVDEMTVNKISLENNQLRLTIMDSLRGLSSDIKFSFADDKITGLSKSFLRNVTRYKHWDISRNNIQQGLDLEAMDVLMTTFASAIEKDGYVNAALSYYKAYSALIGEAYQPEEAYLSAMGSILIEDNKMTEALHLFELATTLYPESVNGYLNYANALMGAKQGEKAVMIYTKGYELAKKMKHKDLLTIESNLKKIKANASATQRALPSPPPPPGGGH